MIRANERLSVLSAEAPLHQPLITDGTAFFQLQEEMKRVRVDRARSAAADADPVSAHGP
jgi:hypothetical protein